MKVHLVDGCFFPREQSATLAGDRSGEGPSYFTWTAESGGPVTFYTDVCLEQAVGAPGRKVAWLIEPPWKQSHYVAACTLESQFDHILTYWAVVSPCFDPPGRLSPGKTLFYPLGGSRIKPDDWGLHTKTLDVSLIVSEKRDTLGHRLRHETVRLFGDQLGVWGRGINPAPSKVPMLRPYRYSIVIESWRGDWYFSEKLIDCISQGTVPIYWGCPDIGRFFDMDGIIQFVTPGQLEEILSSVVSEHDYQKRLPALERNLERARQYQCAEDWIYRHYPFLGESLPLGFEETR